MNTLGELKNGDLVIENERRVISRYTNNIFWRNYYGQRVNSRSVLAIIQNTVFSTVDTINICMRNISSKYFDKKQKKQKICELLKIIEAAKVASTSICALEYTFPGCFEFFAGLHIESQKLNSAIDVYNIWRPTQEFEVEEDRQPIKCCLCFYSSRILTSN